MPLALDEKLLFSLIERNFDPANLPDTTENSGAGRWTRPNIESYNTYTHTIRRLLRYIML